MGLYHSALCFDAENAIALAKSAKPRMTSGRRRKLRLSVEEAVSLSQLHKEVGVAEHRIEDALLQTVCLFVYT